MPRGSILLADVASSHVEHFAKTWNMRSRFLFLVFALCALAQFGVDDAEPEGVGPVVLTDLTADSFSLGGYHGILLKGSSFIMLRLESHGLGISNHDRRGCCQGMDLLS